MERRTWGWGEKEQKGKRVRAGEQDKREEGASAPFIVSDLPGSCQVTVGVDLGQNANTSTRK